MSPDPVTRLVPVLEHHKIDRVFADYWVAYRTSWATNERITAAPLQVVRSKAYERAVESKPVPAYVLVRGSCIDYAFHAALKDRNIGHEDWYAGYWVVVQPTARILPAEALPDWATDRGIYAPHHAC